MHKKTYKLTSRKSDNYYVKKVSSAALEMVYLERDLRSPFQTQILKTIRSNRLSRGTHVGSVDWDVPTPVTFC